MLVYYFIFTQGTSGFRSQRCILSRLTATVISLVQHNVCFEIAVIGKIKYVYNQYILYVFIVGTHTYYLCPLLY